MTDRDQTPAVDLGSMTFLTEEANRDRRGLRVGLLAAVALHLVVFAITWPNMVREARAAEETKPEIYVFKHVRFEPPPPAPIEMPRQPQVPIPIPDATPDDPEPPPSHVERAVVEFHPDTIFFDPADLEPPPLVERTGPVRATVDIEPPAVLERVEPRYPAGALAAHLGGTVILDFLIGPDGLVRDVTVLRPAPLGMTESAVEAALQWRFEASTLNGKPVTVRYTLTIRFTPV
jgi:TonB family protein